MSLVYKICPEALWCEAEETGVFTGAPVDAADGFIHFSSAAQVADTAARHFKAVADLLLVTVDGDDLGEALRYEPSRGGDLFPHLYGPLPLSAVRRVERLRPGPDGVPFVRVLAAEPDPPLPPFDPAAHGWTRRHGREFMGLVGPTWRKRSEAGEPTFGFLVERRHLNTGGVVHGGMLMTFLDQVIGHVGWAATDDQPQVTVQLDTHFMSSARLGEFVEGRASVVRRTRSLMFMHGEAAVGDRLVVAARGVWKILGA